MDFQTRLLQLMKQKGVRGADITRAIGATSGTVSNWTNGVSDGPKGKYLLALADYFEVDPKWLADGKVVKKGAPNATWAGEFEPWDSATALGTDEVEVPYLTEVSLSAGAGTAVQENPSEYVGAKLRFAKSTLKRSGVLLENARVVGVHGNSMEPVLPDGSVVGIDTGSTDIKDGKMYAVSDDGLLRVKVLYKTARGLRLRSYNREEYPDEIFEDDKLFSLRVVGRVFWYSVLV